MKKETALRRLQSGSKNIRFPEAIRIAEAFGFRLDRVSGSYHIFIHPERKLRLNIQNHNGQAKAYQMKQLLDMIAKYDLSEGR